MNNTILVDVTDNNNEQQQQSESIRNSSSASNCSSKVLIQSSILGQRVKCTLSDGRTATGRLLCIDRLKNLILSDCICEQQICSNDYCLQQQSLSSSLSIDSHNDSNIPNQQQQSSDVVYQVATRHLQQAMIPGNHLVSVHLYNNRNTSSNDHPIVTKAMIQNVIHS